MDKETRNAIERATQRLRTLLEEDFAAQLYGDFDVNPSGGWAETAGRHLSPQRAPQRGKIVAALEHKRATGLSAADSVADYLRDAAFTTLNRLVALKMLEARELVQECITRGEQSSGYREFCGLAPGVALLPDAAGYRLYIESLFDELSTEIKVLFDRRDPASVLWPRRATFEQLLENLNAPDLAAVWREDETIGWVYQYFNSEDDRHEARYDAHGKPKLPQNARELAVRNQFFTPRYVVQFLADNTLGRIWYEMRNTKTTLAERCEFLVRNPGEAFAQRSRKDPRDLRVLDPACGSGHFLLYAFDLLVTIYAEAHADPESPKSEETGRTLQEDYPTRKALDQALPSLILAHNLYGVDIDARCSQIAQLALWMRAQRAYREFGIKHEDRSLIRKSNIVVAEPLVTDDRLTEEFVARLGDEVLGRVFRELIDTLKLAGDLGILLRVEDLLTRPSESGQIDYLEPPEARLREALRRFVAEEGTRLNTRKRLFADDATHGLGLLETAEKKFDVVLMNPPFGAGSTRAKKDFERSYPKTKNDVYAAFVERAIEVLSSRGRLGAITSGTYFHLSTFRNLRNLLLSEWASQIFVDLGSGVMDDAAVTAACAIIESAAPKEHADIVFFDVRFAHDRPATLRSGILDGSAPSRTVVSADALTRLPDQLFGYWLPRAVQRIFSDCEPLGQHATATFGLHCRGGDERFYRAWWEVDARMLVPERWPAVFLGGTPQHFFRDTYYVVDWQDDAYALREIASRADGGTFTGREHYFRAGLTYIYTAQTTFSVQPLPEGSIFTAAAHGLFPGDADRAWWLAWLNSEPVRLLTKVINPNRFFQASYVRLIPLPEFAELKAELEALARRATELSLNYVAGDECSRHYCGDWASTINAAGGSPFALAAERASETTRSLLEIEKRVNTIVEQAYALSREDIDVMSDRIGASTAQRLPGSIDLAQGGARAAAREHCSAVFGAAIGRWNVDTFKAARTRVTRVDPFATLSNPKPLSLVHQGKGILTDDEGHGDDVVAQVETVLSSLWASALPGVFSELRSLLDAELRSWIRYEFFPYHLARYSVSQAKAPIYWQLATPSGSYSVWLYLHAFTKDTLFRVQHDYAGPKLLHEEQRLESLRREFGDSPSRTERQRIADQESFVEELRAFLEEIKRVAPLWSPNLDDGVVINFAPLWRLVRHCKPWQKELKATWDSLCAGEYDWAHLAMHLWPARVVPKCAKDRSLAIAHGLEEVFWVENDDGKWVARLIPTRSIEEIVRERTSPAVRAALDSLLQAPVAQKVGGRSRSRRARAAGSA